jgi:hypothetical protein
MRIELKKFGDKLISRPGGREAYLAMLAYTLADTKEDEVIEIDFDGIKVLAPSWADEVITKIAEKYKNVVLLNADKNGTVMSTLKILREYSDLKI